MINEKKRILENKNLGKPTEIYIEEKGQLIKLKKVKIIWSNFRKSYKLINDDKR